MKPLKILKWHPKETLNETLNETVEKHSKNSKWNPKEILNETLNETQTETLNKL
jgi:dTDP-D-glucose 4,6-dehydratase